LILYIPLSALCGLWVWALCLQSSVQLGPIPLQNQPEGTYQILIIVWSILFTIVFIGAPERRCTDFDLTLPISPRKLWLTLFLAKVSAGWLVLFVMASVVALANWTQGIDPLLAPGLLSFAIHLGVSFALTLAILQSPKPEVARIPIRAGYCILSVLAVAGFFSLTIVLSTLPRIYAWIPLAFALLLTARIYLRIPTNFSMLPLKAQGKTRGHRLPGHERIRPFERSQLRLRWLLDWTIFRNSGAWGWAFYLPTLLFHGAILSSVEFSTYFAFFFLAWIMLASWTMVALRGVFRSDCWPISRDRIFVVLTAPPLVAISIGYAAGALGSSLWTSASGPVDYRFSPHACCYSVQVPYEYWKIAWSGEIPSQGSPWGELNQPQGTTVIQGTGIQVYNPFQVPLKATPDLAGLKMSQAIETVYGRRIPYQEIRDRYLAMDDQGAVKLKAGGFTLLQDYPGLSEKSRSFRYLFTLLAVALPWLTFSALTCRTLRPGYSDSVRQYVVVGMFIPITIAGIGSIAAHAVGLVDLPALGRWLAVLMGQASRAFPGGPLAAWSTGMVLLAVFYWCSLVQFRRAEAVVHQEST
jgi:hypothetical protein